MPTRPNILFVTTDQQRWDTIGAYGVVPIRTPHLDALAAQGVIFDRAYCANPVCTPSRISMITSQYPSRHGVYTIGVRGPDDFPDTVGALLGRAGYATGLIGKAHFRPCGDRQSLESPPQVFDTDFYRGWHGPYYGFEYAELCICHTHEAPACGMHYGAWLKDQGIDTARHWGRKDQGYCDIGRWDLPEEFHNSRWVADRTIAFIDRAAEAHKPFFAFASFQDPHNPIVVPEPWYSLHDRRRMPDYTYREGEMRGKPPFYQEFIDTAHYHQGRVAAYGLDGYPCVGRQLIRGRPDPVDHPGMVREENRRNAVAAYYGMISLVDHHLGRVIDHLKRTGLFRDTLIVFTSDHGEYLGNHGLWWKGLPAYEDCHRVPFLACWPRGGVAGGRRCPALQSLVDLGPTFLNATGIETPASYQGVGQLEVWRGKRPRARDWAIVEFRPNASDFCQKVLITDTHKLAVYHRETYGELYDLAADPAQDRNLWDEPGAGRLRVELLGRLADAEMEREGVRRPRTAGA